MKMTKNQQEAKKLINYWLLSDEPEFILSGAAGCGKTWLVNHVISEMDKLRTKGKILNINTVTSAEITATTNKAVGLLDNAVTIQKLLKLRMQYDYKTGKKYMVRSASSPIIHNTLLIIDECSMIGNRLRKIISKSTVDCKVLYVGDHCQLPPVNEGLSPIFKEDITIAHLREPVRCKVPDVFELCTQLRTSVETGVFAPINESKNVKFVGGQEAANLLKTLYRPDMKPDEVKIITYTNKQAIQYDQFIKKHLGKSDDWQIGDLALINNSVHCGKGSTLTRIGSTYKITHISKIQEYMGVTYKLVTLDSYTVAVPLNWNQYTSKLKALKKKGDWSSVFTLEETFADLRDAYSSTAHSAQGSSYGTVFINLTELCKCKDPETFARLLYVSVSRARYKIYFTGKLSEQYGG